MKLYAKCNSCRNNSDLVGYVYDDVSDKMYRVEPMPALHLVATIQSAKELQVLHTELHETEWLRKTGIQVNELEPLLYDQRKQCVVSYFIRSEDTVNTARLLWVTQDDAESPGMYIDDVGMEESMYTTTDCLNDSRRWRQIPEADGLVVLQRLLTALNHNKQ